MVDNCDLLIGCWDGVKIYGGDIVKIQSMFHNNSLTYIGKIIFENGMYMCESKWNKHWIGELGLSKEIIGNIFENKELLTT